MPFEDVNESFAQNFDPDKIQEGDTIHAEGQIRLRMCKMKDPEERDQDPHGF